MNYNKIDKEFDEWYSRIFGIENLPHQVNERIKQFLHTKLAKQKKRIENIVKKTLRETQHDVITHQEVWELIKSKLK